LVAQLILSLGEPVHPGGLPFENEIAFTEYNANTIGSITTTDKIIFFNIS
jgi:hypothetical protein